MAISFSRRTLSIAALLAFSQLSLTTAYAAGSPRKAPTSCARWSMAYFGAIHGDQDLMGVDQKIELDISEGKMTGTISGHDSPTIYIWSNELSCSGKRLDIRFNDNSDGEGVLLISKWKGYSVHFNYKKEGDSRNFWGYFPDSNVGLKLWPQPLKSR